MGNKICCEEEPKIDLGHAITVLHKSEPIPIKLPELSNNVIQHLEHEKPFSNQLSAKTVLEEFGTDIYEGKLDEKGRPHGYGKMYHKNGSVFVGEFVNGIANGQGHFVKSDGSFYHGRMHNNMANDTLGKYWSPQFEYKGEIVNNQIHGKGQQKGPNHSFDGIYEHGKKSKGTFHWKENDQEYEYIGGFNNEQNIQGEGQLRQKGKGIYNGHFLNGNKHGKGVYQFDSGIKYEGEYHNNLKVGNGRILNKIGGVAYEGQFKNGLPHGIGKAPSKTGDLQQANWVNGIDKGLLLQ